MENYQKFYAFSFYINTVIAREVSTRHYIYIFLICALEIGLLLIYGRNCDNLKLGILMVLHLYYKNLFVYAKLSIYVLNIYKYVRIYRKKFKAIWYLELFYIISEFPRYICDIFYPYPKYIHLQPKIHYRY